MYRPGMPDPGTQEPSTFASFESTTSARAMRIARVLRFRGSSLYECRIDQSSLYVLFAMICAGALV